MASFSSSAHTTSWSPLRQLLYLIQSTCTPTSEFPYLSCIDVWEEIALEKSDGRDDLGDMVSNFYMDIPPFDTWQEITSDESNALDDE